MKINNTSRANLFLIELIIVILFFAFSSAILLQVFIKSSDIATGSVNLNGAMMTVQSAIENEKVIPLNKLNTIDRTTYYDKHWQKSTKQASKYTLLVDMKLEQRHSGTIVTFTNSVKAGKSIIYTIENKKYFPGDIGGTQDEL